MLQAYSLPTSVMVSGQSMHIRNDGDWRTIIDCNLALTDPELDEQERMIAALLIFFDIDEIEQLPDVQAAAKEMVLFISAGTEEENENKAQQPKLVDWEYDAQMIVSGINKVIGHEVRAVPYMHWWTFIAAYMSIGEGMLSTVVSIRHKLAKGKKLEKSEREFKNSNPQYFRINRRAEKAGNEAIKELWGE